VPTLTQPKLVSGVAGTDVGLRLSRLRAAIDGHAPIDQRIELWVCVDSIDTPLVRVNLAELLTLGGERPLNLAAQTGATVLVVLRMLEASWPAAAGELQLELI
jgi:hypothetical protein